MKPRWFCIAAITLTVCIVASASRFTSSNDRHLALLERLAPKIERAQALAPASRDAIERLVDTVRQGSGDARYDLRRLAAVERITGALKAKDATLELTTVVQTAPE